MSKTRILLGGLMAMFCALALFSSASGVPIPTDRKPEVIADRVGFIPYRKHMTMPGKIIAVLVTDAQPVLSAEGRSGPADQLCIGWNGGSYRWVYAPVKEKAIIQNLSVPLPEGKTKVYPSLGMASPTTVKQWDIDSLYTLVEVEVNDGAGSPINDSFVATKMKKLDGSKEYPIQVEATISDLKKRYEAILSDRQKDIDSAMEESAKKAIKDRQPTGPREKNTLMFATWMPDSQKLVVRFRTQITDGDYKYGNGINIELRPRPAPPRPANGGPAPPARLPNGLRYGTQFGVEMGAQFEVSKSGKIDKMKFLEIQSISNEIPAPPVFRPRPKQIPLPVPPQAPMKD